MYSCPSDSELSKSHQFLPNHTGLDLRFVLRHIEFNGEESFNRVIQVVISEWINAFRIADRLSNFKFYSVESRV